MSVPDYSEMTDKELWIALHFRLDQIEAKLDRLLERIPAATGSFASNDPGKP